MKWMVIMNMTLFLMAILFGVMACSPEEADELFPLPEQTFVPLQSDSSENNENDNNSGETMRRKIFVKAGSVLFSATLEDTPAAKAFAALLPMTVNMAEMNGNEKYYNFSQSLPTNTFCPGIISTGDLLLWGMNTLVVFYETFSSSYSYTRLGKIDAPDGLEEALGQGNVTVTFELNN